MEEGNEGQVSPLTLSNYNKLKIKKTKNSPNMILENSGENV